MELNPIGIILQHIKQLQTRNIEHMLRENEKTKDLNFPQLSILYQLWKKDNITISELSKRTRLAKTTLTSMLERLEKQGYLQRISNPENRREIRVVVSEKSRQFEDSYVNILSIMQKVNFKGFSEVEETQMRSYLERMRQNLEAFEQESQIKKIRKEEIYFESETR